MWWRARWPRSPPPRSRHRATPRSPCLAVRPTGPTIAVWTSRGVTIGTSARARLRTSRGTAWLPASSGASHAAAAQIPTSASAAPGRANQAAPPAATSAPAASRRTIAMVQSTCPNAAGTAPDAGRRCTSIVTAPPATTMIPVRSRVEPRRPRQRAQPCAPAASAGTTTASRVPPAGVSSMRSEPPSASSRSRSPRRPVPRPGSAPPTPSSSTSRTTSRPVVANRSVARVARACRMTLASASDAT